MLDLTSPCTPAPGPVMADGYVRIWSAGRKEQAHRVAYAAAYGPIPPGMDVGHKCHDAAAMRGDCLGGSACRHRCCDNPAHLLAETRSANTMASPLTSPRRMQARTHCSHGHALTAANTYARRTGGRRQCRACNLEAVRRYKARQVAA